MRPRVTPLPCAPDLDAGLGAPRFGPGAWLQDLELRLGIAPPAVTLVERELACARAMRSLVSTEPSVFFARSFAVDPLGTAGALLELRDALVEAGWRGEALAGAGPRASAIVDVERRASGEIASGVGDRVGRVAERLEAGTSRATPYEAVELLEDESVWPEVWRRVVRALRSAGTTVAAPARTDHVAVGRTDLARIQARVARGRTASDEPLSLRGDGTLVRIRARTSWELGDVVAGFIAGAPSRDAIIVRVGDGSPLDAALGRRGEPRLGTFASTALRAPLQVLPLAMAMLYVPRDPRRALELAELPDGPFTGRAGRALAEALSASPGVGSRAWVDAKARYAAPREADHPREASRRARAVARIEAWFEGPGFPRDPGAPRDAVIAATRRVGAWAARRVVAGAEPFRALAAAAAHLAEIVAALPSPTLPPAALDRCAARALGGLGHAATPEEAGRIHHCEGPGDVTRSHDLVVVWHAGDVPRLRPSPWRTRERAALEALGLRFVREEHVMEVEARAWRRVLLAARSTLVIATPETHLAEEQASLPLWDEIVARASLDEASQRRITAGARAVQGRVAPCHGLEADVGRTLAPLELPPPRGVWLVDPALLGARVAEVTSLSPTRTESLLACPLRWVLESALRIRPGSRHAVIEDERLHGRLGHRLVEELFAAGILADPTRVKEQAPAMCDALIEREGGPLLLPGRSTARAHVRARLVRAMRALASFLEENALEPRAVERETRAAHGPRELMGRMDLLCTSVAERSGRELGEEVIVDLKWGDAKYRRALADGSAVQLAMYAETRRRERRATRAPRALYFSIKSASALTLAADGFVDGRRESGISLSETWGRVERTADAVLTRLGEGAIPASASAGAKARSVAHHGLGERADLHDPLATSGCERCDHRGLCGRAWSAS